jgi:hypothetical protein
VDFFRTIAEIHVLSFILASSALVAWSLVAIKSTIRPWGEANQEERS